MAVTNRGEHTTRRRRSLSLLMGLLHVAGCSTLPASEGLHRVVALQTNKQFASYLAPQVQVEAARGVQAWVNWAHAGQRGTGVPILMLHGYPDSLFTWKELFHHLPNEEMPVGFDLYAVDLPGHGFTRISKPLANEDLAPERAAEFVHRFMDAIGLRKAIVVGNSFGGLVACHLTRLHPEKVEGLVLIDPEGVDRPEAEYLCSERPFRSRFFGPLSKFFSLATIFGVVSHPCRSCRYRSSWEAQAESAIQELSDTEEKLLPGNKGDDDRREHAILMRTATNYWTNRALVRRYKKADAAYLEAAAEAAEASCIPVLLLWGKHDNLFPCGTVEKTNHRAHFREWFCSDEKQGSPDCPEPIPEAAHRPQLEAPDCVVKHICQFIKSHHLTATAK